MQLLVLRDTTMSCLIISKYLTQVSCHNRQHVKLVKRHLDVVIVALVQFLQQHGIGKSAGTFCSRITIGMITVPSWEAFNPCPKAGSGKTGQSGSTPTVRLVAYNQED